MMIKDLKILIIDVFSSLSIIFKVVSPPISEVIKASSISSRASSSTLDLPATARESFPKTFSLVFSKPLSSLSFLSFEKKPNIPIVNDVFLNRKSSFFKKLKSVKL